jgi:hypothetical protein
MRLKLKWIVKDGSRVTPKISITRTRKLIGWWLGSSKEEIKKMMNIKAYDI